MIPIAWPVVARYQAATAPATPLDRAPKAPRYVKTSVFRPTWVKNRIQTLDAQALVAADGWIATGMGAAIAADQTPWR